MATLIILPVAVSPAWSTPPLLLPATSGSSPYLIIPLLLVLLLVLLVHLVIRDILILIFIHDVHAIWSEREGRLSSMLDKVSV